VRPMSPTYPTTGKRVSASHGRRAPVWLLGLAAPRLNDTRRRCAPSGSKRPSRADGLGLVPDCWCLVDDRSLGVPVVAIGHNEPSRSLPAVRARIAA
jgi:hypothetical protein